MSRQGSSQDSGLLLGPSSGPRHSGRLLLNQGPQQLFIPSKRSSGPRSSCQGPQSLPPSLPLPTLKHTSALTQPRCALRLQAPSAGEVGVATWSAATTSTLAPTPLWFFSSALFSS